MRAVVLTFDRLPASLLGCYGNEWVETPGFDQLAAESTVFPCAFAELPGPASPEHPWWTGRFEFFGDGFKGRGARTEEQAVATDPSAHPEVSEASLFETLSKAGISFRFLSERPDGLPPPGISADADQFEVTPGDDGLDADHSAVPFAQLVRRATTILDGAADEIPDLLWMHSQGVPSPWLPPEFFAGLYLDELEDQDESEASGREIADALLDQLRSEPDLIRLLLADPDADGDDAAADVALIAEELGALGERVTKYVFAGYVSLLDHCLQQLTDAVSRHDDILLIVTAAGGVSFGERSAFLQDDETASSHAEADDDVCDSLLRVPLLVRRPGEAMFGERDMRITQPLEIAATVLKWLVGPASEKDSQRSPPTDSGRSLLEAQDDESNSTTLQPEAAALHLGPAGTLAIQTREWMFTVPDGVSALARESTIDEIEDRLGLYAKPDDGWQLNNEARQRPDVCSELFEQLRAAAGRSAGDGE
ncbi:MAG: alkaline phosphatase family protein [Planctomycetota bacterium]|jgi:arylsulfatase A-like enzyme